MRLARALMCEANGNGWGRPHLWLLSYGERRRVQQPLPSQLLEREVTTTLSALSAPKVMEMMVRTKNQPTSGGMLPLSLGADVAA